MFNFFSKKEEVEDLTPVSLHDYPKAEYDAYWEILSEGGPGNYISTVRVYNKTNNVPIVKTIRGTTIEIITREQNKFIKETMQGFKK